MPEVCTAAATVGVTSLEGHCQLSGVWWCCKGTLGPNHTACEQQTRWLLRRRIIFDTVVREDRERLCVEGSIPSRKQQKQEAVAETQARTLVPQKLGVLSPIVSRGSHVQCPSTPLTSSESPAVHSMRGTRPPCTDSMFTTDR
jgi:hypothetical protein